MRLLIDCTYFTKGERHVMNAPLTTSPEDQNELAVMDFVHGFIETEQPVFLASMLGESTATVLQAYLDGKDAVSDEEPEADAELDYLANGLRESLADYVFYKMLRNVNTLVTTTGIVELKTANRYRTAADREASIWNGMVERNLSFVKRLRERGVRYAVYYSENMVTKINALNL